MKHAIAGGIAVAAIFWALAWCTVREQELHLDTRKFEATLPVVK